MIYGLKLVSRDRFTSMEILQKSKDKGFIDQREHDLIKKYYDFEITNVDNLDFNLFGREIQPIYERIYGDGVNIAARIEGLAGAGEICISGTAFDQVESKLGLEFEYLGEQAVKNIKKPVPVHRVKIESGVSDVGIGREPPLPDEPSIAVLPFVNMSGDPEQEYFSDGMSEDIITVLSQSPGMFVIARNSSFTYKGKSVNVQQVSRELGV